MATLKTGWIKKVINDVSTKVFAISHVKSIYYNYTQDKTLADKLDDIDTEIESTKSKIDNFSVTKQNVTDALGYTPISPNEVDNKLSNLETNIDWKEAVSTFSQIATTYPNPQDGWTVNVKDTDCTYRYNGTEWVVISANAIPKATNSVDGLLSKEDHVKYEDANSKKHEHSNKTVLDNTTASYTTEEKSKLSGVAANANNYTHPTTSGNKHIPSGGSSGKILRWSADGTAVWGDERSVPTYTFGSGGDYENIVEGFWHIQENNISNSIIYIKSGVYDLISLITSYFGSSFITNYSLAVNDDGFHGLCLGNGNKIICEAGTVINAIYTGSNETFAASVAPFHSINDSFELHNCKIICHKLRYCIHDDSNQAFGDCTSIIENCHFVNKKTAAGGCIGGGFSPYAKESKLIRNCTFEISDDVTYPCAVYYHTNYNSDSSNITIDNCYAPDQFCFIGGTYTPIGKAVMNVNNSTFGKIPYKCQWYGGNPDDVEIYQYNNRIVNSISYNGFSVVSDKYINAYSGEVISLSGYCYITLTNLYKLTPGSLIKILNINKECHVAFFNGTTYISGVANTDNFVIPSNTTIVYISFPEKYKDSIIVKEYYDEGNTQPKLSKNVLLNEVAISDSNSHTYDLSESISKFKKVVIIVKGNCRTDWIEIKEIDTALLTQGTIVASIYHSSSFNVAFQITFSDKSVTCIRSSITGFESASIIIHGIL